MGVVLSSNSVYAPSLAAPASLTRVTAAATLLAGTVAIAVGGVHRAVRVRLPVIGVLKSYGVALEGANQPSKV